MNLNLNLDYKRREEDEKKTSNVALSIDYITYAISSHYKEGVEGQLKRVIGRLQRKLDEAEETLELEQAEIDIIKKAFEKVTVPTALVKYWVILEDEIDLLK